MADHSDQTTEQLRALAQRQEQTLREMRNNGERHSQRYRDVEQQLDLLRAQLAAKLKDRFQ